MRKVRICFFVLGAVLTLLSVALLFIEYLFSISLFIFGMTTSMAVGIFPIIAIIAFLICLKLRKCKSASFKKEWLYSAFSVTFGVIGCILCLYAVAQGVDEPKYYTLISPDSRHEIVIEEASFLLAGRGSFYQRINPFFIKQIGNYSTDDGFRPFSRNDYSVEWLDDGLNINYAFGSGDGIYQNERMTYVK